MMQQKTQTPLPTPSRPYASASSNNSDQPTDHDIFTDPSIAGSLGDAFKKASGEDPIFKFISAWWKHLLVGALAILAIIYARNLFRDTYQNSMNRSAEVFVSARQAYSDWLSQNHNLQLAQQELMTLDKSATQEAKSKAESKVEELKKKVLESREKALLMFSALKDSREPYQDVAQMYLTFLSDPATVAASGVAEQNAGNPPALIPASQWLQAKPEERFLIEASALRVARMNLAANPQASVAALIELAREGSYVNAVAALTLARLYEAQEQALSAGNGDSNSYGLTKEQINQIIAAVLQRSPEQAKLLELESSRLK